MGLACLDEIGVRRGVVEVGVCMCRNCLLRATYMCLLSQTSTLYELIAVNEAVRSTLGTTPQHTLTSW